MQLQFRRFSELILHKLFVRWYPHRGGNFERGRRSSPFWVRDSLGGILGDNLGEGNCESKIVWRQWGDIFASRHQDVSQGPLGGISLTQTSGYPWTKTLCNTPLSVFLAGNGLDVVPTSQDLGAHLGHLEEIYARKRWGAFWFPKNHPWILATLGCPLPWIQGEIAYAPLPPAFLARRHFAGGGVAYFEPPPPRNRNFIRPLLIFPPCP